MSVSPSHVYAQRLQAIVDQSEGCGDGPLARAAPGARQPGVHVHPITGVISLIEKFQVESKHGAATCQLTKGML